MLHRLYLLWLHVLGTRSPRVAGPPTSSFDAFDGIRSVQCAHSDSFKLISFPVNFFSTQMILAGDGKNLLDDGSASPFSGAYPERRRDPSSLVS